MGREPREVWKKRVDRWRESGLSAREFAAETGVNVHTLSHWAWRLGRPNGEPRSAKRGTRKEVPTPVRFVEVVTDDRASGGAAGETGAAPAIELVVGAWTLRVPPGFDLESLRRLLALLESA